MFVWNIAELALLFDEFFSVPEQFMFVNEIYTGLEFYLFGSG